MNSDETSHPRGRSRERRPAESDEQRDARLRRRRERSRERRVSDTPATSEDPYSAHLQSSVPFATRSMTEQEAVHQSVQERQLSPSTSSSPATMMWPLLEEYPSMSSPPRATSPVHFPHSSLPVREISQGNARIRLPLATTSSI